MSRHHERRFLTTLVVAIALVIGIVAVVSGRSSDNGSTASAVGASPQTAAAQTPADGESDDTAAPAGDDTTAPRADTTADTAAPVQDVADQSGDLDGEDLTTEDSCLMTVLSLRQGESGESVVCLQEALIAAGYLDGAATGDFDYATFQAVERMQTDRDLFVDGIVGRESAISLGIWPDEESWVVRTPPPPPGAVDLLGYPLSSVAVSGPDAPPLPPNSGSGKRVVYDRAGQRVWAVDENDRVVRSYLVSGSKYSNEMPGVHTVYSRSDPSTAWNGKAWLPKMIRYQKTDIGAIGFHAIPLHVEDNSPYMTESELGQRLSGGCQRQANADAAFLWDFAPVGTTVVVT